MNKYGHSWNVDLMLSTPDSSLFDIEISKTLVNILQGSIKEAWKS